MKTYIFTQSGSDKRGYNTSIQVYRVVNNVPTWIGDGDYNTASWRGALASAHLIISEVEGYKTDGYYITRKDVQVVQL